MPTEDDDEDDEPEAEDDTDDPVKAKKIRKKLSMSDKRGKDCQRGSGCAQMKASSQ